MLHNDLYNKILIDPLREGADSISIVSGYATAAMAFKHLNDLKDINDKIKVNLIVGMCPRDGLSINNYNAFKDLVNKDFKGKLRCSYVYMPPAVHSKLYIWQREGKLLNAYMGSANYTQSAFSNKMTREIMTNCNVEDAYDYYNSLIKETIFCDHADVSENICVFKETFTSNKRQKLIFDSNQDISVSEEDIATDKHCKISFLDNNGNLPQTSGLNWGQRDARNRNQAYIRVPIAIAKTDFFPHSTIHFSVITDDNKSLICTRAQSKEKAIHTPHNNSLIGEYFRNRLNLSYGAPIKKEDLLRYGRTDVDFYKLDDETFYMDFSI